MARHLLAWLVLATTPGLASAQATPPTCSAPEYRQFDFWLGEWDVFPTGKANQVASSRIEKLYGGCAVRENWMPKSNPGGGSLNGFDSHDRLWHQTWIDNSGTRVEFSGGLVGRDMILTGLWRDLLGPGKDALVRMTYSPAADGSVRQLGEQSVDFGRSWQPSFDFTYRPKSGSGQLIPR